MERHRENRITMAKNLGNYSPLFAIDVNFNGLRAQAVFVSKYGKDS